MTTVGVIGVGSIGSVLAQGFDRLGHRVLINDIDPAATAVLPYTARSKTALAADCEYIVIAVPTPTTASGGDASNVAGVLEALADHGTDATIIIRSTMPPGSTRELAERTGVPVVYSPEFLRDRSTVMDFFQQDRVVIAGPKPQRAAARDLLVEDDIDIGAVLKYDDYLPAELGKEAHNAFFATKVSFANQIRLIADSADADPAAVMEIVVADSRNTSSHLDPMLGPYGGKCLPKDIKALKHYGDDVHADTTQLAATMAINERAKDAFEAVEIEGHWPDIAVKGD